MHRRIIINLLKKLFVFLLVFFAHHSFAQYGYGNWGVVLGNLQLTTNSVTYPAVPTTFTSSVPTTTSNQYQQSEQQREVKFKKSTRQIQ